jgi:CTP synthase (UTP-ammonia lyase)
MSKVFTYRNVLNLVGANSTEIDPDAENAVVIDMPEYNPGIMGSTMRLGKRTTVFVHDSSVLSKCEIRG